MIKIVMQNKSNAAWVNLAKDVMVVDNINGVISNNNAVYCGNNISDNISECSYSKINHFRIMLKYDIQFPKTWVEDNTLAYLKHMDLEKQYVLRRPYGARSIGNVIVNSDTLKKIYKMVSSIVGTEDNPISTQLANQLDTSIIGGGKYRSDKERCSGLDEMLSNKCFLQEVIEFESEYRIIYVRGMSIDDIVIVKRIGYGLVVDAKDMKTEELDSSEWKNMVREDREFKDIFNKLSSMADDLKYLMTSFDIYKTKDGKYGCFEFSSEMGLLHISSFDYLKLVKWVNDVLDDMSNEYSIITNPRCSDVISDEIATEEENIDQPYGVTGTPTRKKPPVPRISFDFFNKDGRDFLEDYTTECIIKDTTDVEDGKHDVESDETSITVKEPSIMYVESKEKDTMVPRVAFDFHGHMIMVNVDNNDVTKMILIIQPIDYESQTLIKPHKFNLSPSMVDGNRCDMWGSVIHNYLNQYMHCELVSELKIREYTSPSKLIHKEVTHYYNFPTEILQGQVKHYKSFAFNAMSGEAGDIIFNTTENHPSYKSEIPLHTYIPNIALENYMNMIDLRMETTERKWIVDALDLLFNTTDKNDGGISHTQEQHPANNEALPLIPIKWYDCLIRLSIKEDTISLHTEDIFSTPNPLTFVASLEAIRDEKYEDDKIVIESVRRELSNLYQMQWLKSEESYIQCLEYGSKEDNSTKILKYKDFEFTISKDDYIYKVKTESNNNMLRPSNYVFPDKVGDSQVIQDYLDMVDDYLEESEVEYLMDQIELVLEVNDGVDQKASSDRSEIIEMFSDDNTDLEPKNFKYRDLDIDIQYVKEGNPVNGSRIILPVSILDSTIDIAIEINPLASRMSLVCELVQNAISKDEYDGLVNSNMQRIITHTLDIIDYEIDDFMKKENGDD